jgi:hypothetical protein
VKLRRWLEIGPDGGVLLTLYVLQGITGIDDDNYNLLLYLSVNSALNLVTNMSWTIMDASFWLADVIGDVTSV